MKGTHNTYTSKTSKNFHAIKQGNTGDGLRLFVMYTKSKCERSTMTSALFVSKELGHAGKEKKANALGVQRDVILLWIELFQTQNCH